MDWCWNVVIDYVHEECGEGSQERERVCARLGVGSILIEKIS
jgi:hypothetical protein